MMFASVNIAAVSKSRESYHHGDLRNALINAGAALAEEDGPAAVTIRAAAGRVGVTPTAAYRHFADHGELLEAVRAEAMNRLAASMYAYVPKIGETSEDARGQVAATGRGYVRFALTQPGLFRTAFTWGAKSGGAPDPSAPGPYGLLNQALDRLVDTGELPAHARPRAEFAAWAAVHGLALLLIDGPLQGLPSSEQDALIDRTITMVIAGLPATAG